MYRLSGSLLLAACVFLVGSPAPAGEAWLLSVEVPAALPLSQPQSGLFGPGALLAVSGYRSASQNVLGGLRLRAGAFANGSAPADRTLRDPGVGGLGSLALALRVRPLARPGEDSRSRGLWIEVAGGGALTGTLLRPTAEAGLGWNFAIGRRGLTVGPSLRYVQVVQPADPLEGRDARIGLVGVEVWFFDPRPAPAIAAVAPPQAPAPSGDTDGDGILDPQDHCPKEPEDVDGFEDQDGCPDLDNDRDTIVDSMDRCPDQAEVVNAVEDTDGCPDEGLIELVGDRIILEERVLFDTERARVKTAGRRHLAAIAELWKQHPEWSRMTIEGHTDVRGPDRFNDWLSEERAERVRATLIELGMPGDQVETKAYGRTKPRDPTQTPDGHQQNRRVEFVILTKKQAAAAGTATPPPRPEGVIEPPRVNEAPPPPPVAPPPVTPPPVPQAAPLSPPPLIPIAPPPVDPTSERSAP